MSPTSYQLLYPAAIACLFPFYCVVPRSPRARTFSTLASARSGTPCITKKYFAMWLWYRRPGSNRYDPLGSPDFKSGASAYSATPAYVPRKRNYTVVTGLMSRLQRVIKRINIGRQCGSAPSRLSVSRYARSFPMTSRPQRLQRKR